MLLEEKMWYQVYVSPGNNEALNSFQDIFLRYFEVTLPHSKQKQ
jgi:hypothetical protein